MTVSTKLHNQLTQFLIENQQFTNWVVPSDEDIALEYRVEYELKDLGEEIQATMYDLGYDAGENIFPNKETFIKAVKTARKIQVNPSLDAKIDYRTHCPTIDCLMSLIKGYRSYPKYRNENTIQAMANAFDNNKPMKMAIVLQYSNAHFRVMGGNTRMNMAFIKGINPVVLMIDIRNFSKKM